MRWLCLVHLPPRRECLQAGLQVAGFLVAAGSQAADFHVAAGLQAADFHAAVHAPVDSTAHRRPGVGSAVEAVVPGRRALRAPRIFPGQDPAPREAWLRKATLPAAAPNRAPPRANRIFHGQEA